MFATSESHGLFGFISESRTLDSPGLIVRLPADFLDNEKIVL